LRGRSSPLWTLEWARPALARFFGVARPRALRAPGAAPGAPPAPPAARRGPPRPRAGARAPPAPQRAVRGAGRGRPARPQAGRGGPWLLRRRSSNLPVPPARPRSTWHPRTAAGARWAAAARPARSPRACHRPARGLSRAGGARPRPPARPQRGGSYAGTKVQGPGPSWHCGSGEEQLRPVRRRSTSALLAPRQVAGRPCSGWAGPTPAFPPSRLPCALCSFHSVQTACRAPAGRAGVHRRDRRRSRGLTKHEG